MNGKSGWAGLVFFASVLLLVTGAVNLIEGIAALVSDRNVVLAEDGLFLLNVTAWGWTLLIFGLVMLAVGAGLFQGQGWARVAAIVLVGIHAVAQVFWLGAYPLWSILMIVLDVVILFALTAHWTDVRRAVAADRDL
jgi:uncharacterized membrane protein